MWGLGCGLCDLRDLGGWVCGWFVVWLVGFSWYWMDWQILCGLDGLADSGSFDWFCWFGCFFAGLVGFAGLVVF